MIQVETKIFEINDGNGSADFSVQYYIAAPNGSRTNVELNAILISFHDFILYSLIYVKGLSTANDEILYPKLDMNCCNRDEGTF